MNFFNGRLQLIPSWKLSRFGFFSPNPLHYGGRACDEYHNPSIFLIIPLVGEVVVFPGKEYQSDRVHLYGKSGNTLDGYIDPNCDICSEILGAFLVGSYAASQPEDAGIEGIL